jgi:hypothetical protein
VLPNEGTVRAAVSAGLVLALGLVALLRPGRALGASLVAGIGALLVLAVLLDRPIRTVLAPEGIVRVCPLRTSTLPWSAVLAIERARTPVWRVGDRGGLVARTRRGRWLLSDRAEAPELHDAVARLVAETAPRVRFLASRPT